ncbi:hypothetical protein ACHHYP_01302 [Achlya hypogyna]|uniref:N-acetyltransferase domain-containing protein n=1 Tax=Achlya hypogyna TaxID=1202772 RepID=A0A1V9Z926_ACHHY|nr:hypothetical protein ACHHYP_01302 [Achlya hypogyna]
MLVAAASVDAALLHAAFMDAYSDYIVRFDVPFAQWLALMARHNVDLTLSRAEVVDGFVVGFALASPRPNEKVLRLASLGVVKAARRSGLGARLLDDFIARASALGMTATELEVIAQNEKALRLYEGHGFVVVTSLYSYSSAPSKKIHGVSVSTPEEITPAEAFAVVDSVSLHLELPLQVIPVSLKACSAPLLCWKQDSAVLIFTGDPSKVNILCLVDPSPNQQNALELVTELRRRYINAAISMSALQRRDVGGSAFERAGFEQALLHQFLMRRPT